MSKMKHYISQLEKLSLSDSLAAGHHKVLLFLSGSSHLETAALTPGQLELLRLVCPDDFTLVESNFPFNSHFEHKLESRVGLLRASLSNISYYWHSLYNPRFRKELDRHLKPLLQAQAVVIICKSSGLNMLTQWLEHIEKGSSRLKIIALGPVSQQLLERDDVELLVIKGEKDVYSNYLDHHEADHLINSNHFDYEYREDVRGLIYDWIRKKDNN